jgi:DNA-binding GntR family transcriptional regulator
LPSSGYRSGRGAVVDDLAASIQARIMSGEIPVGARLRQERLAAEYSVSRTPVREALRKLQATGTVLLRPNQGAVVRGPTVRDIREAYVVRAELEALAAELAASWIAGADLERLRTAEEAFSRAARRRAPAELAGAGDDWSQANDLFHEAVLAGAGNARLGEMVLDLHRTFPRGLTWKALMEDARLRDENAREHRAILEAIEARDGGAARDRMRRHVLHAGELIARWFERHGAAAAALPDDLRPAGAAPATPAGS